MLLLKTVSSMDARTLALIDLTPNYDSAHLGVVTCTLPQPKQVNDWRRTLIFPTYVQKLKK